MGVGGYMHQATCPPAARVTTAGTKRPLLLVVVVVTVVLSGQGGSARASYLPHTAARVTTINLKVHTSRATHAHYGGYIQYVYYTD